MRKIPTVNNNILQRQNGLMLKNTNSENNQGSYWVGNQFPGFIYWLNFILPIFEFKVTFFSTFHIKITLKYNMNKNIKIKNYHKMQVNIHRFVSRSCNCIKDFKD